MIDVAQPVFRGRLQFTRMDLECVARTVPNVGRTQTSDGCFVLAFRFVAAFSNEDDSVVTSIENRGQISDFSVKKHNSKI